LRKNEEANFLSKPGNGRFELTKKAVV